MRILLVAYACEPGKGSEPGVGWNVARGLCARHEVVVVTRAANRAAIERALAAQPGRAPRFLYYDTPRWLRFYKRGRRGVHLYYGLWQLGAFALALHEHRARPFGLVQHVTFGMGWYPTLFAFFPAPLLWGPFGCNEPVPAALARRILAPRERLDNRLRGIFNGPAARHNPLLRLGRARAARLLVVNEYVRALIEARHRHKTLRVPIVATEWPAPPPREHRAGSLRALYVGELIGLKGLVLGMHALARVGREHDVRWILIGDGRRRAELETLASELGVRERVELRGALGHADVRACMREADVLLFPAFDAGGMVVVEALSQGLPVVCLDTGGPREHVDDTCGVRVPVGGFDATVEGLAAALTRLCRDADLRARLAAGAARRARAYTWAKRNAAIAGVVEQVARELAC